MELNYIEELISIFEKSTLHEFELSIPDGASLKLVKGGLTSVVASSIAPRTEPPASTDCAGAIPIRAATAGIFMSTHPMRSQPAAPSGIAVGKGDVLGYLKIGLICAPITSTVDGVVSQVLAVDGQRIGFGEAVFEISNR